MDDAGEALKDSQFCATVERADGLIIVARNTITVSQAC